MEYPGYTEELYYDRAGNRRRRVSAGVEESYKYDPANHLTEYTKGGVKTTFTYDNAGNLTADDRARYTYDLFNRTEKVETFDGHVQVNRYDAENLRHEMEEDGKLVQFIFRGQEVVMEENGDNKIRHIRGYELIASDAESARTYYHYASDEMGSITHVAEGKDVLNRYEYDAWGNLTLCEETVENRFKFNGQQYDPISQQYYLRARYYNPVIARFTQEDTYRGAGLNLYAYCWNNPVYYVDPSGHQPNCVKDAAQRYMEQGMSAEEAYRRAYAEHAETKLANAENLTPQERYRLEERQRRLRGEEATQTPKPDAPDNNSRKTPLDSDKQKAYDDARARGLTAAEAYYIATGKPALNQAGNEYMAMRELQKIMDQYQQFATQDYNNRQGTGNARQVGTWTHNDVKNDMRDFWKNNCGDYPYIKDVILEQTYLNGSTASYNANRSSRIDMVITNNINNNVHIVDLKTGGPRNTYTSTQQSRNQNNYGGVGNPNHYVFTHQEIRPK